MSTNFELLLQTQRIKEIPFVNYEHDFTFIVNGEEFQTTRIVADLLSPLICNSHLIDSTLSSYTIDTVHKGNFQTFLNLTNFISNDIPEIEIDFIYEIMEKLGNDSIKLNDKTIDTPITNETILGRILQHSKNIILCPDHIFQDEIDYLSSHFSEIIQDQESNLLEIPINVLEQVFRNDKLKLDSEDQLLSFITCLYTNNSENSCLFAYVDFNFISPEYINDFISKFDINDITQEIWQKLSMRLTQDIAHKVKPSRNYFSINTNGILIPYEKKPFQGIFNYFSVNLDQIVEVTSSSVSEEEQPAKNVLDFNDHAKYFFSDDGQSPWICFNFKDHKVIITHYSIRKTDDFCHPKSWVIEGSNDNKKWTCLDEQENASGLDNSSYYTFTISNQDDTEYQYIRMRMTGKNSSEVSNCIIIDSFEFYGTYI